MEGKEMAGVKHPVNLIRKIPSMSAHQLSIVVLCGMWIDKQGIGIMPNVTIIPAMCIVLDSY